MGGGVFSESDRCVQTVGQKTKILVHICLCYFTHSYVSTFQQARKYSLILLSGCWCAVRRAGRPYTEMSAQWGGGKKGVWSIQPPSPPPRCSARLFDYILLCFLITLNYRARTTAFPWRMTEGWESCSSLGLCACSSSLKKRKKKRKTSMKRARIGRRFRGETSSRFCILNVICWIVSCIMTTLILISVVIRWSLPCREITQYWRMSLASFPHNNLVIELQLFHWERFTKLASAVTCGISSCTFRVC